MIWASEKRFCKAAISAPSPQPASSTRCGSIFTSSRRSSMRADTSRRRKSDSATRVGVENRRRTKGRSIGALSLALALGGGKDMKKSGRQDEIIGASLVQFPRSGAKPLRNHQDVPPMFARLLNVTRNATASLRWLPQLLPSSCVLCGQTDRAALCQACHARHFTAQPRRCVQCAMPIPTLGRDIRCGDCLKNKPAFDATVVVADYAAPADQLVLALKYGAKLPLASPMAAMLHDAVQHAGARGLALPTLLTPVPLGRLRLQERRFNQSLEMARPLARLLRIRLDPHLLVRLRDTQAQATLPNDERKRNMRRAFVVPTTAMNHVRGAHIGVIDDVITTGETLNEIAATLKRFGARRVTNIVFARTLSK